MNYHVTIDDITSIDEIEGKWNHTDYINLLELFEFGDPGDATDQDLKELLYLAISEYEPVDAAAIVLKYKLQEELNDGQYDQLSNDMLKENVSEKYSDISLHSKLFDVNEFLYKAYNGKFPHAQASVISFTASPLKDTEHKLDKADALRLLSNAINPHAIIARLYKDQISGEEEFPEAEHIAWYFKATGANTYQLTTSDYWINREDLIADDFEAALPVQED